MKSFIWFLRDALAAMTRGGPLYRIWISALVAVILVGGWHYINQLQHGLVTTGLSDQVSWGFYIANFAFLVGIAASAVLLIIPAYIFNRKDIEEVVLLGEGMAVAAVLSAMLFVIVDLGRPDRLWHMIPMLGRVNFPASLLAWDVVVLSGYLALNLLIPLSLLFTRYRGLQPNPRLYFPLILLAILWAISIHTVTAFLFSANSARPFWNTSILAPRFIASAFASGPALIIIALQVVRRLMRYPVHQSVIETLALIMAIALQINLFFVVAELFTHFYNEGAHSASLRYLYLGLDGSQALTPWIWTAVALNLVALVILMIHPLRRHLVALNIACGLTILGIWIEKGMGMVVPGFIPTPLGEVFEYTPTLSEILIALGIWALGTLVFTLLAKAGTAIESGQVRAQTSSTAGDQYSPEPP